MHHCLTLTYALPRAYPYLIPLFYATGAGESGKSTILKQMRIIHTGGFHLDERKEARQVIFSNLVVAYKIIIEEMKDMGIQFENKKSEVSQQDGPLWRYLC